MTATQLTPPLSNGSDSHYNIDSQVSNDESVDNVNVDSGDDDNDDNSGDDNCDDSNNNDVNFPRFLRLRRATSR